ncbi:TrbM/KikA/MpfK family conjugal transfer protein [Arcobacter sp. CECT 9188]|uniref:TrbM/KikA/MpfK family conjugal transfer protein n=1 Tax=Arcobacter sp. CECT 9188 TaxID=2044505 RepID=UPI000DE9235D|nr:TrbM/KikA/MpfK family conjugal transfer protein [Arcobacter sp. CECT 9188]RBQ27644.1 hypothetical protein CRU88_02960 [Arcobacter sp. CECT 9188]
MLKKIVIGLLLSSSLLFSNDLLTGDTKLSCEAILCLSSSTRPSECSPSLSRYFSINHKKWSDTIKARGNFLKLCPVGSDAEKDSEFTNLRDNIIKNLKSGCDLDELNIVITKFGENDDSYTAYNQISPHLTKSCKALASSKYTDIRPIYTCDPNRWYLQEDWNNGYQKVAEKTITRKEYNSLSAFERVGYESNNFRTYTKYKKVPIEKNCWIWQK